MTAVRTAAKVDLYRQFQSEYVEPKTPEIVRVRPAKYLAIRGKGTPGSEEFQAQLRALYSVGYTLKFQQKQLGHDFRMLMLEGLYEIPSPVPSGGGSLQMGWTLLLRVPSFIRSTDVQDVAQALVKSGKPTTVKEVRLIRLAEGRTVQLLHIGSYADETRSIESMNEFAHAHRLELRGPHHEIYLSDPRRVPEKRLRTILRYPVAAAA